MKSLLAAAAVAALIATSACAPVIEGGPPMDLPPGLQETAQVGSITMSSAWLDAEEDFSETFSEEVREELSRCMYGTAPIDIRIHVDRLERAGRLDMLLNGEGMHALEGTVEFVDPRRVALRPALDRRPLPDLGGDDRRRPVRRSVRRPPDDGLGRVRPLGLRTGLRPRVPHPRPAQCDRGLR